MNCQQTDKIIFEYCDNKLAPEVRAEVENHLKNCMSCRKMSELSRQESIVLANELTLPCLSEDFSARLMNTINNKNGQSSPIDIKHANKRFRHRLPFYWSGVIAAALAVLILYVPGILPSDILNLNNKGSQPHSEDNQYLTSSPSPVDTGWPEEKAGSLEEANPAPNADNPTVSVAPDIDATDNKESNFSWDSTLNNNIERNNTYQFHLSESTPARGEHKSSILADTTAVSLTTYEPTYIHPDNLPAEYAIDKIINPDSLNITYIYRNTLNNNTVEITISSQQDESFMADTLATPAARKIEQPDDLTLGYGAVLNTLENTVFYNDHSFKVNIKSSISPEELAELASSIKFKEVSRDDTKK